MRIVSQGKEERGGSTRLEKDSNNKTEKQEISS